MAPKSNNLTELVVSESALQKKWKILGSELQTKLGFGRTELLIEPEYVSDAVAAGFVGSLCEYIERDRGPKTWVVPLLSLRGAFKAWLGYNEVWQSRSPKRYAFRHVALTVFLGNEGEAAKAQIFRAEWPGIGAWTASGISYQSPGAGQPHWQFDVLKTLRDKEIAERDRSLARLTEAEAPKEFDPSSLEKRLLEKVRHATLERMHFASAAPWWQKQLDQNQPSHMNVPSGSDEVTRWTLGCVSYIRQELRRC